MIRLLVKSNRDCFVNFCNANKMPKTLETIQRRTYKGENENIEGILGVGGELRRKEVITGFLVVLLILVLCIVHLINIIPFEA